MDLQVWVGNDEGEVEDFGGKAVAYDSELDGAGGTHGAQRLVWERLSCLIDGVGVGPGYQCCLCSAVSLFLLSIAAP